MVRYGSMGRAAISVWISLAARIRGSTCRRLMPLTLTNDRGLVPRSINPHRIAQLSTSHYVADVAFVLGARSSDFNHCSTVNGAPLATNLQSGKSDHLGRMCVSM